MDLCGPVGHAVEGRRMPEATVACGSWRGKKKTRLAVIVPCDQYRRGICRLGVMEKRRIVDRYRPRDAEDLERPIGLGKLDHEGSQDTELRVEAGGNPRASLFRIDVGRCFW